MAKLRTERQWAAIIEEYQRSGLTQAAFCLRESVALSSLVFHLRRHRRAGTHPSSENAAPPRLVELQLPTAPVPGPAAKSGSSALISIEWDAVRIRCQCHQVGEILAQIQALAPGRS